MYLITWFFCLSTVAIYVKIYYKISVKFNIFEIDKKGKDLYINSHFQVLFRHPCYNHCLILDTIANR